MRKRKTRNRNQSLNRIIRLFKESQEAKESYSRAITHEFNLSETDKITYTKGVNDKNIIIEVINVSYEVNINDQWVSIWRYDSEHGYLHCHMRISLQNSSETVTNVHVIKKGTPHTWFTWAINDIKKNYLNYRKGFMRRSKLIDNYEEIILQ